MAVRSRKSNYDVKYEGENVRVDRDIKNQVVEYVRTNGGKIKDFYDDAVKEKLRGNNASVHLKRILERIEEAGVQNQFLSAYQRAKDFLNNKV